MRTAFSIVVCLWVGLVAGAGAAQVESAKVERDGAYYHVDFAVTLEGRVDRLRRLLTDYERLQELSTTMVESRLLRGRSGADARIEVVLRPCVLIVFCKTLTKVSDSTVEAGGERIRYDAVPGRGDFETASESIVMKQLSRAGAPAIHLRYTAVLRPAFSVPAFVGPWLIRRAILSDLEETSRRVEQRLGEDKQ